MVPPGQATTIERSRPNRCRGSGLCCLLLVGNTSEMLLGPAMFRVNSSLELASSDPPLSIHRNFKLIELNPIVDPHEIIMKSSSKPVLSSRLLTNFSRLVQLFQFVCFHRLEAQGNLPV